VDIRVLSEDTLPTAWRVGAASRLARRHTLQHVILARRSLLARDLWGRVGWWWIVGPDWDWYPAAVYPYPDPYTPSDMASGYWYWCDAYQQYYPYVGACPSGWHRTAAVSQPARYKSMMTRRHANIGLISSAAFTSLARLARAQESKPLELPAPRSQGGRPLIEALKLRRSIREYSPRSLPPQVLSDLLWAAFGINRPATGARTAPYWRHLMVIDIYAAMADGVWIYDPKGHKLLPHMRDDIRAKTGTQDFVATAPLNLVYIAHG
jgi:hypothetical protein